MRAHNAEHLDSLPVIDVSSLKHIAYVFDSLIYFLRSGTETTTAPPPPPPPPPTGTQGSTDFENLLVHDPDEPDDMSFGAVQNQTTLSLTTLSNIELGDYDEEVSSLSASPKAGGKKHIFFQRSESTLCLGCPAPDPFLVCQYTLLYTYTLELPNFFPPIIIKHFVSGSIPFITFC